MNQDMKRSEYISKYKVIIKKIIIIIIINVGVV